MNSKVLILEDEPDVAHLVETVLNIEKIETVAAASAAEARTTLFSTPVELLIVDRMLSDQDGLEFVKEMKKYPCLKYCGVIFLTARTLVQERLEGFSCGADDYIIKPFNPEELLSRTKAVLKYVSPLFQPLTHLPALRALEKECSSFFEENHPIDFFKITLSEYPSFKNQLPDKIPLLFKEIGTIFYQEMNDFETPYFTAHLSEDQFVLLTRQNKGEELVSRFQKSFSSIRKSLLRKSVLDYFKTPSDSLLQLTSQKYVVEQKNDLRSICVKFKALAFS
ncbi:MAG: response regulator transcription factor [Firmicutes bacterium]|nr:response regulator transcription factor [Bacillota bacterium]